MVDLQELDKIREKFPSILKDRLKNGEFFFPACTQYEYTPIKAYRGIARDTGDFSPVTRDDFRSYAEMKKRKTRGCKVDRSSPQYYGVSFFTQKERVENVLAFPNPKKKIIYGEIFCAGGPCLVNDETEHVCWWLYENTDISGVNILQD